MFKWFYLTFLYKFSWCSSGSRCSCWCSSSSRCSCWCSSGSRCSCWCSSSSRCTTRLLRDSLLSIIYYFLNILSLNFRLFRIFIFCVIIRTCLMGIVIEWSSITCILYSMFYSILCCIYPLSWSRRKIMYRFFNCFSKISSFTKG